MKEFNFKIERRRNRVIEIILNFLNCSKFSALQSLDKYYLSHGAESNKTNILRVALNLQFILAAFRQVK